MTSPVYLISTERSGSNLLRKSLSTRQDQICCTIPPAHFLRTFNFWSHCLGPFSSDEAWFRLAVLYRRSTLERAVPWSYQEKTEIVLASYEARFGDKRDPIRLADHFYTLYANHEGFKTYLCKDIWLNHFALEITEVLPDAKFIHLVRDPRDVAASQKKRPFGNQNVAELVKDWKAQTDQMLRYAQDRELSKQLVRVRYEDLIGLHEETCAEILDRLHIKPSAIVQTSQIQANFHEWKNLDKPVMADNAGKFRDDLYCFEIKMIEAIAWHTMRFLGYKTSVPSRPSLSSFDRHLYPRLADLRYRLRVAVNRYKLKREPIDRSASRSLVKELERDFR